MIEPRLYRAAFIPALLAIVVAAFSLENRPRAVPQGLPADVWFEGTLAPSTVGAIVHDAPDRRAGKPGDARTARRVTSAFRHFGFQTTVQRFDEDGHRLTNVIGRRPGGSPLIVEISRAPKSVMASVRGMGVAVMTRTSGWRSVDS